MERRPALRVGSFVRSEEPAISTIDDKSHLSARDIERLLDGRLDETDRERFIAHLQLCRKCVEAYLEFAAQMGFQRVGESGTVSTRKTAAAPRETPESARPAVTNRAATPPGPRAGAGERASRRASASGSMVRAAAVAASVVAVTAAVWFLAVPLFAPEPTPLDAGILRPIERAVGEFTRVGAVVLPGGEAYIGTAGRVFRSPNHGSEQLLGSSLKTLVEEFLAGSRSPDVAYWLVAGYLASGDLRTASVYAATARERFPRDQRLQILDATVAYFRRDYERSESLLRGVIGSGVRDPLAGIAELDLALVLRDQGKTAEAKRLLLAVASRPNLGPLAARGRDLAASLEG